MKPVILAGAVALALIAGWTDLRSRRIPNWLVVPFLAAGIAVSVWLQGWHGFAQSAAGFGLGLLIFGILFCLGGMGMGDVKLCAAIGAWIGPSQLLIALVVTGLAGGVMAVCWAACRGVVTEVFTGSSELIFGWKQRGLSQHPDLVLSNPRSHKMPYAPAIAIGTVLSFFAR